ncbi:MAG: hypothetical protein WC782_15090 [Methylococcaceae bacterium]|jgi:hypothetical protein
MLPLPQKPKPAKVPDATSMLERVRGEAAELRNFTLTFLSLLLYVGIIIASTTHEQLLRDDPVNLPWPSRIGQNFKS